MKSLNLTAALLCSCVSANSLAQSDDSKPDIYLNQNLGFNVEGYNYAQSEFPCDIDTALVNKIIERATNKGIRMEAAGTADTLLSGEVPVLAIDIEALALGSEEFKLGTDTRSNLPSVKVTAGLIDEKLPGGVVTAKHSCAIATLNQLTPSSNVMDMGTPHTVCSATHKCLNDLSNDIVEWVSPQL